MLSCEIRAEGAARLGVGVDSFPTAGNQDQDDHHCADLRIMVGHLGTPFTQSQRHTNPSSTVVVGPGYLPQLGSKVREWQTVNLTVTARDVDSQRANTRINAWQTFVSDKYRENGHTRVRLHKYILSQCFAIGKGQTRVESAMGEKQKPLSGPHASDGFCPASSAVIEYAPSLPRPRE